MRSKKPRKPEWYTNTSYWISLILVVVAVWGLPFFGGEDSIRDPGQKYENGLALFYLGAAVAMFINGWMTHRQNLKQYDEETSEI